MFKVFPSYTDRILDALGITRWIPLRKIRYNQFWALRGINFELPAGHRIGIIGRNGAGKSTLLKLVTGNLSPSEGTILVNGQVQALFETGAGFHPDFTGYENIRSSLMYQGFSRDEIVAAIEDIAEFTELGPFLGQPFKTYSTGMQARLTFATATSIKPDILIIDEILGAGDSYFFNKSQERMNRLVEKSGASVLIVSHALDQIVRFCEEAIWIDRGKIVERGPAMNIVDSYQRFIRLLDDRRLKAKNKKIHTGRYYHDQYDHYGDSLLLIFQLIGKREASADISEIRLLKGDRVEEKLLVGDVQDTNPYESVHVVLTESQWSDPRKQNGRFFRELHLNTMGSAVTTGHVVIYSHGFFEGSYSIEVEYRTAKEGVLSLTVSRQGDILLDQQLLPQTDGEWMVSSHLIDNLNAIRDEGQDSPESPSQTSEERNGSRGKSRHIIRWPSDGSIKIENVAMFSQDGIEKAVYQAGEPLLFRMTIQAQRDGHFEFIPTATLYRLDGVFVSNFIGPVYPLDLKKSEKKEFQMTLNSLNLGSGHYVFSAAIFEKTITEKSRYDLISRGYEFQVLNNDPLLASAVFSHPSVWSPI